MKKMTVYSAKIDSPIGVLYTGASEKDVLVLAFSEQELLSFAHKYSYSVVWEKNHIIDMTEKQLNEYFDGKRKSFDIPLKFEGTQFQKKSWNALLSIPYGQTISYKEEAIRVGNNNAVRAVGTANSRNPIAIIAPCHRVIGINGRMAGYGGGIWRKEFLLKLEKGNI